MFADTFAICSAAALHAVRRCWGNESPQMFVLVAPVCLSMLLNLLFLCNIVRVLMLKLKAPMGPQAVGGETSRNILQAFR